VGHPLWDTGTGAVYPVGEGETGTSSLLDFQTTKIDAINYFEKNVACIYFLIVMRLPLIFP
jgi:hypothetical protein